MPTNSDSGTIISDGGGPSFIEDGGSGPVPFGSPSSNDTGSCGSYYDTCGTSGNGGSCGDCGSCDCDLSCGSDCQRVPGMILFGEYLFLRVSDADLAHAQQQNGIGGAGTVPFGDIGTLEIENQSGVRLGGGIGCGDCSGVLFSYTFFESDSFNSVEPPFIPGGGGAVGSLVHHPALSITASVGPVDAAYQIDMQLADVMFTNRLVSGCGYAINYLLGAQYGHIEQDFAQTGNFSGGTSGTLDTFTAIDFDGGGLKAGFDSEHCLCGGLTVYGKATGALLAGEFRSQYVMLNSTTEQLLCLPIGAITAW